MKSIESKIQITQNSDSKSALKAALNFLKTENEKKVHNNNLTQKEIDAEKPPVINWGVFTYYYNDKKCDYQKFNDLGQGQKEYKKRGDDDTAKLFVADGEVTRSKGDQVAIEICQGKALMDGNLKEKLFDKNMIYVVNHESNSIYNDIRHFSLDKMEDA